jgi:predicted transcriptional regulator
MSNTIHTAAKGLLQRLGRFEKRLLQEVNSAAADAYCRELARRLDKTEGQVSRSLSTLTELGVLERRAVQPQPPRKNQRTRFIYSVTDLGRKAFF